MDVHRINVHRAIHKVPVYKKIAILVCRKNSQEAAEPKVQSRECVLCYRQELDVILSLA